MSESYDSLRKKIEGAGALESVVRTMKALAASSIGQYERATASLTDYYRAVELGLYVCFRQAGAIGFPNGSGRVQSGTLGAVVFGSDQGLVGQFNDVLADFVQKTLKALPGKKRIYAVGERIHSQLADVGLPATRLYPVPNSVRAITPLVGQILVDAEAQAGDGAAETLYLFHHRPTAGAAYEPVSELLLPLDEKWRQSLEMQKWPTKNLPQAIGSVEKALLALVHEYLFSALFRACAESLASENASRLAAMQRAEKNIGELLEGLTQSYHRLRQDAIDEELFDLIAGFEALRKGK
ncbi:MAG: F0F1 ATP synthase subunit gamma [Phaeodactylibacter sp.]|nr:F0F1 ATP synthase subunit gamma [Phaeodactylibacter sp.]MCB9276187.1 F0F1 ATP synthase subunit gamma [Lewinellaceae bacterium]